MNEPSMPSPVSLPSQKRSIDALADPQTPLKDFVNTSCSPLSIRSIDTPSPMKAAALASTSDATQPSSKRRKFTEQEKEEQRHEKEAKSKAKAEKRAQKDEEKRKRDAEREGKKRAKELKQQQEEEEKQKKERSQLRLNSFFAKPKLADAPKPATIDSIPDPDILDISSLPPKNGTDADLILTSPQKAQNDYDRFFLPFSLPPHAVLAPQNAFIKATTDLVQVRSEIDSLLSEANRGTQTIKLPSVTPHSIFPRLRRGCKTISVARIINLVNGSATYPIDLTHDARSIVEGHATMRPIDLLKGVHMKYLHFPEDVRPPYFGTYTKIHNEQMERKVALQPSSRALDDLNYDYDSEAEWEEPEEGEDLGSEGEEDLEDDGDEEMDGFLDDEGDTNVKRRMLASNDQEPISTGLCWNTDASLSVIGEEFRMVFLLDPYPASIDPFSTAYWVQEPVLSSLSTSSEDVKVATKQGTMNPPRLPLASRPVNGLLNTLNMASAPVPPTSNAKAVKPKRMIPSEDLAAFRSAIEGRDLTKLGMIEALKKEFPKVPKDAITNTLTAIAQRVGPSEKEKRWVLLA